MSDSTNEQGQQLIKFVSRWDRRRRLAQLPLWIPRGLAAGLLIGLGVALISRLRPWLLPPQIVAISGAAALLGVALALVAVLLWPRRPLELARYFDQLFELKERSSTALELSDGSIIAPEELTRRQLQDAVEHARTVEARRYLPFRWSRRELGLLAVLVVALALAVLLVNPQAAAVAQQAAVQSVVGQAVQQLQQVQQTIKNNPALSEAEKAQLNKIVDEAIQKLQQPNITKPEAVAALTQASQQLNGAKTQLTQQQLAAAQEAGQALDQNPITSGAGDALQSGNLSQAANQLQSLARKVGDNQLTPEQAQQAADALTQAAQSLRNVNPAAAQALRDAAQALKQGNMTAAQQALNQAANALNGQQQQMNQSAMSQAAQSAMQTASQGQQQVAQAGQLGQQGQPGQNSQQNQNGQQGQQGQNGQQNQNGQNGQQGQPGQQGQSGQQGQPGQQGGQQGQNGQQNQNGQNGQQGQPGQQGQQGQNGQQGGQQGQNGQQGQPGGAQEGAGNVAQNGQGQSAGTSQQQGQGQSNSTGAGQGPGGAGEDVTTGQNQNSGPIDPNNGHSDGSLVQNESIYAPSFIGGKGGAELNPKSDSNNGQSDPSVQVNSPSNPAGQSTVPLGSVAGQASSQADQAMDTDHIPGALRGVVRDYFTGLQSK